MYCPQCGVNNDRGETTCYICGSGLPSSAVFVSDTPGRPARIKAAPAVEKQGTVGDRALALFFDSCLLAAILAIGAAWQTGESGKLDPADNRVLATAIGSMFILMLLYHTILEGAFGATLGKAMMGLRVRAIGGSNRFLGALIRNVLRLVDSQGLYLVGFLFAMFTQRGQRIGDLAGKTVVLENRMSNAVRGGLMALWLILIIAACWFAWSLCPTCRPMVPR
jgi:uncharacterized RDD family membrane protein YckC